MISRLGTRLALVAAIATTIACDRVTKQVAASTLAGLPGCSYLADTIRLQYAENTGGFLELGAGLPPFARTCLFTVATGLLLLGTIALARHFRLRGWPLAGVGLFVAGGASNWLDRLVHGRVVDFLNVGVGPLRTGIFNVADVAILCGACIVVLTELGGGRRAPSPPSEPTPRDE